VTPAPSPRVVVLAAPSGGGKTTIARELRTRAPGNFGYSVSATTRKARPGEQDGEAYHFLTRAEFLRRREAGEFLEWAEYAGELYGTLLSEVERVLASGRHVVLDVEVKGARQVRKAYPRPASLVIFVIPPSARVLVERLRRRRTETEAELSQRIDIATREVETARREIDDVYDHVLVNDDLETAVREVIDLVQHSGSSVAQRAPGDMASLLADFAGQLRREVAQLKQSTGRSR
jgi:guanylate kinase